MVQLCMSLAVLVMHVRWLPHYNDLVNKIRAASYALVLFCAMTFVLLSFRPGIRDAGDLQQARALLLGPLLGYSVCFVAWRRLVGVAAC